MMWCCGSCGHEWPITNSERELPERRMAKADWRPLTPVDRRRQNG
jgi:hypothetical protein